METGPSIGVGKSNHIGYYGTIKYEKPLNMPRWFNFPIARCFLSASLLYQIYEPVGEQRFYQNLVTPLEVGLVLFFIKFGTGIMPSLSITKPKSEHRFDFSSITSCGYFFRVYAAEVSTDK